MKRRDTSHHVLLKKEPEVPNLLRRGIVQCTWRRQKGSEGIYY